MDIPQTSSFRYVYERLKVSSFRSTPIAAKHLINHLSRHSVFPYFVSFTIISVLFQDVIPHGIEL